MQLLYPYLAIIVAIYLGMGVVLFFIQGKLIFRSKSLSPDYLFSFDTAFREVNIALKENDNLSLVQFFCKDPGPKGLVLYFHGNRENVNRYGRYAEHFTRNHYEVWMVDFPGYGKSRGKQSEENFYFQAEAAYRLALEHFGESSIILYGKSLGSGIASHLAAGGKCRRLILETPYYSMGDLLAWFVPIYPARLMTWFKFPVGKNCSRVQSPITIFVAGKDRVIPSHCSEKIRPFLKPSDEFITILNGRHLNLSEFAQFHEHLDRLLAD